MLDKIKLNNVTLVTVTGVNGYSALKALLKSMDGINFNKSLLITSENIITDEVEIINIPPLNYEGYSKFMVYDLYKYISTDFALIVQADGYVINPDKWDNAFLKYDYIGAPWALPTDNFSFRDPFGKIIRVGNGGFSLRSKKLMELPTQLDIPWAAFFGFFNEDGFISCHHRHILEENGCVFAPIEVASKFSQEADIPENKGIIPFGFHGKWCKYFKQL